MNKSNKFTPGPWTIFKGASNELCLSAGEVQLETLVSGEANARLIAAAPELLEALCSIYYMANLETHLRTKYSLPTVQMIMQQMANAIAKATGGAE